MNLYYCPDIQTDIYNLPEEEARHAVQVLRSKVGERVQLIDGKGGFFEAEIAEIGKKFCTVRVLSKNENYGKRPFQLHIAAAPTKNIDRYEWFLEKATEIGIDKISPLLCDFSERKIIKNERLEAVTIAAMKQSYKAYKPDISELTKFSDFIKNTKFEGQKFIAHCYESEKKHLKNIYKSGSDALILIGPEGDFSPKEIALAKQHGFTEISLSPARLRTETAAVVACHIVNLANEL